MLPTTNITQLVIFVTFKNVSRNVNQNKKNNAKTTLKRNSLCCSSENCSNYKNYKICNFCSSQNISKNKQKTNQQQVKNKNYKFCNLCYCQLVWAKNKKYKIY